MLIVFARKHPLPKGRVLAGVMVFGALQFSISCALIYWSLLEVPAGLFQVILALVPLFIFLLAIVHWQKTFQWRVLAGGLLALIGIAIIFRRQISTDVSLIALLAVILAGICFAEAAVLFKTFPKSHTVTINALAMGIEAAILFGMSCSQMRHRSGRHKPARGLPSST